jgi:hypothetical protein
MARPARGRGSGNRGRGRQGRGEVEDRRLLPIQIMNKTQGIRRQQSASLA